MNILVCGRGRSLEKVKDLIHNKYDYVILVNEFNEFVRQDENLKLFLSDKKIIQFVNIEEAGVDNHLLENFDIYKIYTTRLVPNGDSKWWRQVIPNTLQKKFNVNINHPSEKLEPYMIDVENSSDVAILFSILDLNADVVDVVGVDFYETDYHLDAPKLEYIDHITREKIKTSHKKIINKFPNCFFNYYTKSNFSTDLKNLIVNKI